MADTGVPIFCLSGRLSFEFRLRHERRLAGWSHRQPGYVGALEIRLRRVGTVHEGKGDFTKARIAWIPRERSNVNQLYVEAVFLKPLLQPQTCRFERR